VFTPAYHKVDIGFLHERINRTLAARCLACADMESSQAGDVMMMLKERERAAALLTQ
jgi:hypothetical protein